MEFQNLQTRREKPREIEALEGPRTSASSLRLSGLSEEAARSLLQDEDLRGESAVWPQLIATCAGNPLALKPELVKVHWRAGRGIVAVPPLVATVTLPPRDARVSPWRRAQ